MSSTESPSPGPNVGINSQIAFKRALPRLLRNSRILCWTVSACSAIFAFLGLCMLLMVFSLLFQNGSVNFGKLFGASQWGLGGLAMLSMCPWLWNLGRRMAGYQVTLEPRGVTFKLGTKKKPSDLFLPWEQITAIKRQLVGNAQQYRIEGRDGSEASFSSYTFFRPQKIVAMIAERTGLSVQILK